jgi:hypothetical protein
VIGFVFVVLVAGIPGSASAQAREGFWFGMGGGYGSAGVSCDERDDEDRESSGVGYLRAVGR